MRAVSSPILKAVSRLNTPLSKVIYLLSSEPVHSDPSKTGLIADCALRHLGYNLTKLDYSSSSDQWTLCPGSRVFCLLGNRVISRIHGAQNADTIERLIKSIWSWFLHNFQANVYNLSDNPLALADVNPNLIQLVCLLAGQIPGLTAKKSLLYQLMSCFDRFSNLLGSNDVGLSTNRYYHLCTRLMILIRYLLHHFYLPPAHLADQLKPSLTLQGSGDCPVDQAVRIWTYDVIQSRLAKMEHHLRPFVIGSSGVPLFYDLLTPSSLHHTDSKENGTRASWNLPSPDGLVSLTTIHIPVSR